MGHADILERVTTIVREELENPSIELHPGADLADVEGWDSVIMSATLINLEREYGIEFAPAEIDSISTIDGLVDAIATKMAPQHA